VLFPTPYSLPILISRDDSDDFARCSAVRRRTVEAHQLIVQLCAVALFVLLVVYWLVASRPVDWPWNWNRYLFGRAAVNNFLGALEANDLEQSVRHLV